jgi:hypothetical protein
VKSSLYRQVDGVLSPQLQRSTDLTLRGHVAARLNEDHPRASTAKAPRQTDMDVGHSVVQRQQMTVMCTDSSATSIFEERVSDGFWSRVRRVVALYTALVHAHGTPSARGAGIVLKPTIGSTVSFGNS